MAINPIKSINGERDINGGDNIPSGADTIGASGEIANGNPSNRDAGANGAGNSPPSNENIGVGIPSEQPRKRGRKPGSKNAHGTTAKTTPKDSEVQILSIAKNLEGFHALLALSTGKPQLAIAPEEAMMISRPYYDLAMHYGWTSDGVMMKWVNLFVALGVVYGRKFMA